MEDAMSSDSVASTKTSSLHFVGTEAMPPSTPPTEAAPAEADRPTESAVTNWNDDLPVREEDSNSLLDADGETDDEPTIRAPHSSASSETMSASDADSIYTEDSQSEYGEDVHPHTNGVRGGEYSHHRAMSP